MLSSTKVIKFPSFWYIERGPSKKALVRKDHSYYLTSLSADDICGFAGEPMSVTAIKDSPILLLFVAGLIACPLLFYFSEVDYRLIDSGFLVALVILALNVGLHELGHMVALKALNQDAEMRFGVKAIPPFPSFYVDTSDSYMLPTCKRITVYLSGVALNSSFIALVLVFSPELSASCYLVISMILVNLVPIMKCDGFHCVMAVLGRDSLQKSKKEVFVDEFLRGLAAMLFLLFVAMASSA